MYRSKIVVFVDYDMTLIRSVQLDRRPIQVQYDAITIGDLLWILCHTMAAQLVSGEYL